MTSTLQNFACLDRRDLLKDAEVRFDVSSEMRWSQNRQLELEC